MQQRAYSDNNIANAEQIDFHVDAINRDTTYCANGSVYTRPEVVDFILDLSGYSIDKPLCDMRVLEPSFGEGAFLFPIISRLLLAWRQSGKSKDDVSGQLGQAITAIELNFSTYLATYSRVIAFLEREGISTEDAIFLASEWLICGDFLTCDLNTEYDFVVGNPPYIRQEALSASQLTEYRNRYKTFQERADIYVPFFEKSLGLLTPQGYLGFICSDRWMKNHYGQALRGFIASNYFLKIYVDMVGVDAFYSNVTAYPAIFIISRTGTNVTHIVNRPNIDCSQLNNISKSLFSAYINKNDRTTYTTSHLAVGAKPWLIGRPEQTNILRRIEHDFIPLENASCKVGIGVATGADKVFINDYDSWNIEESRKLPLITTKDLVDGSIKWRGKGVLNPFLSDGSLVRLSDYPMMQAYLEANRSVVEKRHCAKKNSQRWYRTIDRITPELLHTPKLLIPDIKGHPHVVLDEGRYYPHHNLYYILSEKWDLRALQAILLSSIAKLFILSYSTKMRGGFLRFQAQYLRRIHIPNWDNISQTKRKELVEAAESGDISVCDNVVFELYNLDSAEQTTIREAVKDVVKPE